MRLPARHMRQMHSLWLSHPNPLTMLSITYDEYSVEQTMPDLLIETHDLPDCLPHCR